MQKNQWKGGIEYLSKLEKYKLAQLRVNAVPRFHMDYNGHIPIIVEIFHIDVQEKCKWAH